MQDRRIVQLNVSQSFLGFLWATLFSGVIRDVLGAHQSALALVPLPWIKCGFAVAVAILVVGLVHSFWGWTQRIITLEDFVTRDIVPRQEFVTALVRLSTRTGVVVLSLIVALVATYWLFPTAVNGYVVLFVATLWVVWMGAVVISVIDRLGS